MQSIRFGHLVALFCFFALAACGSQDAGNGTEYADDPIGETAHLGQWQDTSEDGRGQVLAFNEDGTFMMGALDVGESLEGAYDIEYRDNVAAIDLHFGDETGLVLADFPEADTMRVKAPDRIDGNRPTDFEPEEGMDIVLFTRQD